jgi:hypothetical protein
MKTNGKFSVSDRMRDSEGMIKAMEEAIHETVREHKLLGFPIVVWQDGKVVWIPPEEIELSEESGSPADR